jgi:protoporphyrinogen oxidase
MSEAQNRHGLRRRSVLACTAALPWTGCARREPAPYDGAWLGAAHPRGHRMRESATERTGASGAPVPDLPAAPGVPRRADVIVVGAGIAGLAAARALRRAGIDDVHVFELEDSAGGNSRGHVMGGMRCPLGAHYLPVPGAAAVEVAELLAEYGLSRGHAGRSGGHASVVSYDERHLCHSPQERLFMHGEWVEGLLPPLDALPAAERGATQRQYRAFQSAVEAAGRAQAFAVPTARARPSALAATLDAVTFASWLDAQGLTAPALRWYLDYCCRDDYGANASAVSAWAGLHYFASRHGFHAPGADAAESATSDTRADTADRGAVLTWPDGNAWLAQRLAAPLGERLHTGQVVQRVQENRHEVGIRVWDASTQRIERWSASHAVLAVPVFVAARLWDPVPSAMASAAAMLQYAPWLVANLHLHAPLADTGGAAPAWDNVIMDSPALGYVDAMHQSLRPHAGPTVLTAYWALGGDGAALGLRKARAQLLDTPWSDASAAVVRELERAHPDIATHLSRVDLMRYGHAMAIPAPGVRAHGALRALSQMRGRVRLAHADLSGYSVFEEAFFHGERVGRAIGTELRSASRKAPRPIQAQ